MPSNSGHVVGKGGGGGVATIKCRCEDILVRQGAGEFQVGYADGALWVGSGGELCGDGGWKGVPPEVCGRVGRKPDAPHAKTGGVAGTNRRRGG